MRLGAEDVEREAVAEHGVVLALEGEHADLRSVAVADDEVVVDGDLGKGSGGVRGVVPLHLLVR